MAKLYQLLFHSFHVAIGESSDSFSGSDALLNLPNLPIIGHNDDAVQVTSDGRTDVIRTFYDEKDEEELQMTCEQGISLKPVSLGYQVKVNDEISGNMPYRENVRFKINYFIRCIQCIQI